MEENQRATALRGIIILLVIAAIGVALLWFIETPAPKVPESLILGVPIDSSPKMEFGSNEKVDFVQYRTDKEIEEIISYYMNELSQTGWSIIRSYKTSDNAHNITATKNNETINIAIFRNPSSQNDNQNITVGVTIIK